MHGSTSGTRRERDVNYGDKTPLAGSKRQSLAWVSLDESAAFTVYASARVEGPAPELPFVVPMVTIEWGHGGASSIAEFPVVRRLRVPLAASMIKLEGRLVDVRTGSAPSSAISCELAAFIAPGNDGETHTNARTVVMSGAGGLIATGPQRVLAVHGYNAGAADLWLMLFDASTQVTNGAAPKLATPAPRTPTPFALRPVSPRDFLAGVTWAASTTPLQLTAHANAVVHLEVELLP